MSETHVQWARRIGRCLNDVNVNRLKKLLTRADEHFGAVRWEVRPCKNPVNTKDDVDPWDACWCAMVYVEGSKDPEAYVIPSATMTKLDAEMLVEVHNTIPAICELRELLEQPTWCGRCGRDDLKLWGYHEHVKSCMSTTDEEYRLIELEDEVKQLKKELIEAQMRAGGFEA